MKDKRTYTNSKEHGEDMSHENEIKIEAGSIPTLIEMHKKEIWEWKQKESEWIKTENLLQGKKEWKIMKSGPRLSTRWKNAVQMNPGTYG